MLHATKQSALWLACLILPLSACTSQHSANRPSAGHASQMAAIANSEQWLCQEGKQGQWQCSDLRTTAIPQKSKQQAFNAPLLKPRPMAAGPEPAQQFSESVPHDAAELSLPEASDPKNLNAYPGDYYAVQLLAALKASTVSHYLERYPQLNPMQITLLRDDQHWQVLLLGVYPTYSAAKSAVELYNPLAPQPWIRPVAPLQKLVTSDE